MFYVNWFRKGPEGKFLWPGYGDNSRVLKWVFERCEGTAGAAETPIGAVPRPEDLELGGLSLAPEALRELLKVDRSEWLAETEDIAHHFERFGDRLPPALSAQLAALKARLR
jgi:phosphoenolpyruvate carboxykinase (GTP)